MALNLKLWLHTQAVVNPDLEVMSSRRIHHSAGPGLESATVPTGCRFTVLLQTTHLLGIYLFCTSQKMFPYKHDLRKKNTVHQSYHCISYLYDYKTMKNFQENSSIISSDKILRCL